MLLLRLFFGLLITTASTGCNNKLQYTSSFPDSRLILGVELDLDSVISMAPGSDNWPITWAQDDNQYTTWGDGGGFGGSNKRGRVSFGVARIEGTADDFTTANIWGGYRGTARAQFAGKSYGILDLEGVLWLWRTGNASNDSAFLLQELFYSKDKGANWLAAGVKFTPQDFQHRRPFFAPTFLQFGAGYQGNRDNYVYIYAPDVTLNKWDVQLPGEISLMRVPRNALGKRDHYEFFSGMNARGQASWSKDADHRSSIFSDINGVMRTSVSYNEGLQRYLLITQQVSRFRETGHIGIYEAEQPWGPWYTVLFASPWKLGLQTGNKSVYWNFSNKWSSKDGRQFSLVYTGPSNDNFGVVQGRFITTD
jgi:hypothetical protein